MRRKVLLLLVMAAALAPASGVALAAVVNCQVGAATCDGTNGDDTMNGTAGSDVMRGLKGDDKMNAGADFDTLNGGRGADILNGQADADTLSGDRGPDALKGGPGDDTYLFADGWGKDTLSDDAALGTFGERLSFSLVTEPIVMDLIPAAGRPEVRSGNNRLNYGAGVSIVEVDGSSAGDVIRGENDADSLNGIQGNDTVSGRGGADTVVGMDGNDTLIGGGGADNFEAGPGADTIRAADNQADQIDCGGGNDTVFFDQGVDAFLNAAACENKRPS